MAQNDIRKKIIMESLQYYSEALAKLLANDELPSMVKFDLNNEYVKLYRVQSAVLAMSFKQNIDESKHVFENEEETPKVIHSALSCYKKGLEKSISEIDGLHGDKTIPLQFTRENIELAENVLKEI